MYFSESSLDSEKSVDFSKTLLPKVIVCKLGRSKNYKNEASLPSITHLLQ